MINWLELYHGLPYSLRVLVASTHGYQLRHWRYGSKTAEYVRDALKREKWSAQQLKQWQEARLARMLEHSAANVPFYRNHWMLRRRKGDKASPFLLANWPILKKETIRQNPKAFLSDKAKFNRLFHLHTSGTTGKPLELWRSHETNQKWYALIEARWRGWYGLSRQDRWGLLGGQLVTAYRQQQPPFWVWNAGLRQLYMSSYHLAPANVPAYLEAISRYNIVYLLGYASSLHTIAQNIIEQGLHPPPLKVIISNAEPLYKHQRQTIEKAFNCPVYDTYGMAEAVAAASECEEGMMHLWPEAGIVEVLHEHSTQPVPPGDTGRLICTGLINFDMPLIRYEIGDRGSLMPDNQFCDCGRTLPLLNEIEGRLDDVIVTIEGRRIGRLDPLFKADLPIREAQIIQERLDTIRVKVVPTIDFSEQDASAITQRLRDRVGPVNVTIEQVNEIPRGKNGKFRAVISEVTS